MARRSAAAVDGGITAAEYEDPGILADDSSDEGHNSADNSSSLLHDDGAPGLHDSDFDADAEVSGSSSGDEAAASSGDEQPAAAGDPDSDIDAGLDDDMQPSSSSGADEAGGSVGEGSSDRGPQGNSSTDDDDGNPSSLPSNRQQQHASFLEGGKSASFAKAFAKIMAKPSKAAAAKAAAADVILSESASMAKRKAEVAADEAAAREAKKQRLELKKRGHFKVPKKGEDTALDVREKQLQKLATRGVVLLFNAVNKAQRQKREAEAAGLKGVKALKAKPGLSSKAGFFAELQAGAKKAVAGLEGEQLVPGAPAVVKSSNGRQQGPKQSRPGRGNMKDSAAAAGEAAEAGGAGWDVLGEGFPGLTGGVKMKDWDKAAVNDEELNGQALAGSDDDDDVGDDGW